MIIWKLFNNLITTKIKQQPPPQWKKYRKLPASIDFYILLFSLLNREIWSPLWSKGSKTLEWLDRATRKRKKNLLWLFLHCCPTIGRYRCALVNTTVHSWLPALKAEEKKRWIKRRERYQRLWARVDIPSIDASIPPSSQLYNSRVGLLPIIARRSVGGFCSLVLYPSQTMIAIKSYTI